MIPPSLSFSNGTIVRLERDDTTAAGMSQASRDLNWGESDSVHLRIEPRFGNSAGAFPVYLAFLTRAIQTHRTGEPY
jgi:hypothetical protein